MELRDYLQLARRHWRILLIAPIIVGALGFLNAVRQPKMYSATSTVFLRPNDPNERLGTSGAAAGASELVNADRLVKALANIAKGPAVREAAAAELGATPGEIELSLAVSAALDSNILRVTSTTRVPDRSASFANAVAKAYIENRRKASVAGIETALADMDKSIADIQKELDKLAKEPAGTARDAELENARTRSRSLSDKRQSLAIDMNLKKGEAELISSASPPASPVSPKPLRSGMLGAIVGLMGAFGALVLWDRLDLRLRSKEEAEKITGLPTLAEIPLDRMAFKDPVHIAAIANSDGLVAEAIRSLRVSLRFASIDNPYRVILLTSAMPSDGKSTTATNLAASYAQAGARTLLISADLRRPRVESITQAIQETGLVEILSEMAGVEETRSRRSRSARTRAGGLPAAPTRRRVAADEAPEPATALDIASYCHYEIESLWVLPAGRPVANPVEILGSPVAKDFFAAAREQFDIVIVDSPPVVPVSDSLVMSHLVDALIFVTSLRHTNRNHVARAMELLGSVQANVAGVVLNRVPRESGGYYGGYYAYTSTNSADGSSR